ncbi:MAG: MAPEG family protein [Proteobacteria bacterium]|nr:MAPEG family protein [Pseudomonadota bacterium]
MTITPVYAGLLGLIFLFLTINVILGRGSKKVSLGDGGDEALGRRIRAHANFAEYVPFALLLFVFIEQAGANVYFVHGINLALLIGRIMHAIALSSPTPKTFFRSAGAGLTIIVLAVASVRLLVMLLI